MSTFKLILRTPETVVFEGDVTLLRVNQADGSRSFLAGHEDCLGNIAEGVCKYVQEDGTEKRFVTSDGFFLIKKRVVSVNAPIIDYGDDVETVMNKYAITSGELRSRYLKSRAAYVSGKIELSKSIAGKKQSGEN